MDTTVKTIKIPHGKGTDWLTIVVAKGMKYDPIAGKSRCELDDFSVSTSGVKLIRVSTLKLLAFILGQFTVVNTVNTKVTKSNLISCEITIDEKELAALCCNDLTKCKFDNFHKTFKSDLEILETTSLAWREKIKGKTKQFQVERIIDKVIKYDKRYLITVNKCLAEYLINRPMTEYPIALLSIDGKSRNAYSAGYHMAIHYYMKSNRTKKNKAYRRLSVRSLVNYTGLPQAETLKLKRRGKGHNLQDPFYSALSRLTKHNLLSNIKYVSKGGKNIDIDSDEFIALVSNYHDWMNSFIEFDI